MFDPSPIEAFNLGPGLRHAARPAHVAVPADGVDQAEAGVVVQHGGVREALLTSALVRKIATLRFVSRVCVGGGGGCQLSHGRQTNNA